MIVCFCNVILQNGSTALIMASQNGHAAVVHRLLEANAKVDFQMSDVRDNVYFICLACTKMHTEIINTDEMRINIIDINI